MIVISFEKHLPADCPAGNEKALKANMELMKKLPEFGKKYGYKVIGAWIIHGQHLGVYVFDVPSLEAIKGFESEPETIAWRCFTTVDYQIAVTMEETQKLIASIAVAAKVK